MDIADGEQKGRRVRGENDSTEGGAGLGVILRVVIAKKLREIGVCREPVVALVLNWVVVLQGL